MLLAFENIWTFSMPLASSPLDSITIAPFLLQPSWLEPVVPLCWTPARASWQLSPLPLLPLKPLYSRREVLKQASKQTNKHQITAFPSQHPPKLLIWLRIEHKFLRSLQPASSVSAPLFSQLPLPFVLTPPYTLSYFFP